MLDFAAAIDSQIAELKVAEPILSGKLVRVVGLTLEAKGIIAPLGAHCRVENIDMGTVVDAEVVGFNDDTLYLMPFSEPGGIGPGARVWVVSRTRQSLPGRRHVRPRDRRPRAAPGRGRPHRLQRPAGPRRSGH